MSSILVVCTVSSAIMLLLFFLVPRLDQQSKREAEHRASNCAEGTCSKVCRKVVQL